MPLPPLPPAWRAALADARLDEVGAFVDEERRNHRVFPPANDTFRALELTPPEEVRVVVVGQDPYHRAGQAHGLAFSVPEGTKPPPSLRNLSKELAADLGVVRTGGDLSGWAREGVLLLNAVLTVREGEAGSHAKRGWEAFTDRVVDAVSAGAPCVFVLWGAPAQAKAARIDLARHRVVASVHPSPLSAHRGFFGSRPFSRTNAHLAELGRAAVDWARA